MAETKVIHISDVQRTMNRAMRNKEQVCLKAWKIGRNKCDPQRGELRSYDGVYVTSHTPDGHYRLLDPLAADPHFKVRMVFEPLIAEFMGRQVIL